jgi:hypothetical protein
VYDIVLGLVGLTVRVLGLLAKVMGWGTDWKDCIDRYPDLCP